MCDYSLHGVPPDPQRSAISWCQDSFGIPLTRGFSSVEEPNVAVCLSPGTEIAFQDEVQRELTAFQFIFSKKAKRAIPHKVARFSQLDMDNPCTHHDALEFPDGQTVLLTHLRAGQHAIVLQLPAQARSAKSEIQDCVAQTGSHEEDVLHQR